MRANCDTLAAFLPPNQFEYELVVAHPDTEWISPSNFERLFDSTPVEVSHLEIPDVDRETLYLFHDEEVVATSSPRALTDVIGAVNAMIRTGAVESLAELDLPSILRELDEVPFAATGPDDGLLKLLFTTISRHIEATAVDAGDGRLRVGFQRLSRLRKGEEDHTRAIYERLAETDIDVHVYGRPDWVPPASLDVTIHGGHDDDFLQNWFLVFRSGDESKHAAFLANEHERGSWRGHWTFQRDRVDQINRYLERRL